MKRVYLGLLGVILGLGLTWSRVNALPTALPFATPNPNSDAPAFLSPYSSSQPLEDFLVFTAPPRPNVPDGQIHWTEIEVPGIDVLGPDTNLYNMCPDGGRAWTLQGGDPYGGGTFVAVECQGRAQGWQMLGFHLCEVGIRYSIDASNRVYTDVPAGARLARECSGTPNAHTHLSLGYWASEGNKLPLACPQWYVQGRYWVNAACQLKSSGLPATAPLHLTVSDDWELHYLTPSILDPLRQFTLLGMTVVLGVYVLFAFFRPASPPAKSVFGAAPQAILKTGIWVVGLILLILISAGPVWPIGGPAASGYTRDPRRYQAVAEAVGYSDWELLRAFYLAAVPRNERGEPARANEPGKVFPPEAAAVIPFGETDAEAWKTVDPTQPGPYGQYLAWDAVAQRWPVSSYERYVLGLEVSREAQRQRDGLQAIAASADIKALGLKLGKTLRAEDLYGSSAGAVGRTQILPGYFASDGLCGSLVHMDIWNDRIVIAECTTRYLTVSGCWGRWWDNGDVWSALCGYNPGAWKQANDQWYWNILQDRLTRLTAAGAQVGLRETTTQTITGTLPASETNVSTPVLGLLVTEALLQNGQSAYGLPGPLDRWVAQVAPSLSAQRAPLRILYRVFRAWTLIYYSPEDLLKQGIQL